MDITTLIGLLAGLFVMYNGIISNGSLMAFYDVGSIYITIGGTFCALLMNFPLKSLKRVIPAVSKALFSKKIKFELVINNLVELSDQARRGGLLSLEEAVSKSKDEFFKRAVMTIIDSHDPEKVRDTLETELSYIQERHASVTTILEKGAAYGPAFGMLGTLIGLINMLKNLNDMDSLGASMSIALVTTFYGSVLANVIFLPLAGKLKALDEEEMFCKQLIIEGVLSIQVGDNPKLIQEKLTGFMSKKEAEKLLSKNKKKSKS